MCRHLAPRSITISTLTMMMVPAVDRLGCSRIKRNMIPGTISTGRIPVHSFSTFLPRTVSVMAMNSTAAYFASSPGWKDNGPRVSHRREPLMDVPMPGIATSSKSRKLSSTPPTTTFLRPQNT